MRGVVVQCGGATIELMPERTAYWRETRTLLVADLHFGKADSLRAVGAPMSEAVMAGVLREDLKRLERAIERVRAERVIVVGDLLHAPAGLTEELVLSVASWRGNFPWRWVLVAGNHDRRVERVAREWDLELAGERMEEAGLTFVHAPERVDGRFVIAGHVHPAAMLRGGGDSLRLPAFWWNQGGLVLPAFSRFCGGVGVRLGEGERLFAVGEGEVFEVPARVREEV